MNNNVSRRDMLKVMGLVGASAALGSCAKAVGTAEPGAGAATTAAPQGEPITLDVISYLPEYQNSYRQILDLFEAENTGIKINLIAHSEDGQAAYAAKVAGGYVPAMEQVGALGNEFRITRENYQNYVDLGKVGFPYFDRITWDVQNAFKSRFQVDTIPCIDVNQNATFAWVYHVDLMEKAGLDPRNDVKNFDDLKRFLDEGTKWAKSAGSGVAHFWDQGWLDGFGYQILDVYGLAFPESQYDRRADAYKGNIPFNGDDSPYRPQLEFFKEAYDKGWLPENFWTRQWESDMEAGFVAKQTVLLEHGPWVWDKAKAADPSVELLGFPHTPPAAGQDSWLNYQFPPAVNGTAAWAIRAQNETGPNWEAVKKLYFWWFSPEIVKLRAEAEGVAVNYNLDEPLNLTSPMFVGLLKDISTPGGKWEHVKFEYRDPVEEFSGFREAGSPGVWDFESGNIAKTWADLLTGKITVQDVLDQCQKNWEISYPKLVAGELQG